jgi:hypothetical protein
MAKSVPQPRMRVPWGNRFSLRTLFFVSGVVAVPFLLFANLRHTVRPEETVASPLYLLLGIAGVVFAAAIGSAVGSKPGLFAAAGFAGLSWIALIALCGIFSQELMAVLPVHVLFAIGTVAVLAVIVWSVKTPEVEGPHDKLLQLLKVKRDVQEAQHARHPDSAAAESKIQNPESKI